MKWILQGLASALVLFSSAQTYALEIRNVVAPESARPGQNMTLGWSLDGRSRVTHTNIHWGTQRGALRRSN
jgi:hypothetical protein